MASDNIPLNPGLGGAVARTFADLANIEWPAAVACYATTVTPGANVLQVVTPLLGLPVAPADSTAVAGSIGTQDVATTTTTGMNGQSIVSGIPTIGSSVGMMLSGASTIGIRVGGIWTGTLQVEKSSDEGATYTPMFLFQDGISSNTFTSITGNCTAYGVVGACTNIRVRAIASQSGSAAINIQPGYGTGPSLLEIEDAVSSYGSTFPTIGMAIGAIGSAGNMSGLNLDSSGNLDVNVAAGGVADQVARLYNGTSAVTPQYAPITASASGATTLVNAVSGKKIYVLAWSLTANGIVTVNFQSHATTSTATGSHYMNQYAHIVGPYCPAGIFATAVGEALDINLSASVSVGGQLTYAQF